jgi:FkbM family methyltransferase
MQKIKALIFKILIKLLKMLGPTFHGHLLHQKSFEDIYALALIGMNIGTGAGTSSSGEVNAIKYVKSKLKTKNPVLFDVGANVGSYSELLIEYFKNDPRVFSFEPSRTTFEKLNSNLSSKHVSTFNFGFGETNSKLKLYSNFESSGLASVYNRRLEHFGIEMKLNEEVELKTIDSFCDEMDINMIDFLKIDVEGHEISVLKGATILLNQKKIRFIQFEFGGCNIDSRTYFQDFYYLLKDNYYLYRIVKDGIYKIENYKEMYEAFNTTNYLAELID